MNANKQIENKMAEIHEIARGEIIRIARKVLRVHVEPLMFHMIMGGYKFTDKNHCILDQDRYTNELNGFLSQWDDCFSFPGLGCSIVIDKEGVVSSF